jgi:hypothetical protein
MPYLKDVSRLREAIEGRTRWVFVTNLADGHREISGLAFELAARWAVLGINPDGLMDYGLIEFFNRPTGHRDTISVLTVPKSALGVDEVNAFLGRLSRPQQTDGSQDLIGLCPDTERGREAVTIFLLALHEGSCRTFHLEEN